MNNNSTALAEKVKGLDAKKIGNALLNNALIIIMLAVAVYVAVSLCTKPDYEKADAFIAAANLLGRQKRPPQQG